MPDYTYLDCSTRHISRATLDKLSAGENYGAAMTVAPYDYGVFVSVPTEDDDIENLPEDLAAVLRFTRLRGCLIVRFDADGEVHVDLPGYPH